MNKAINDKIYQIQKNFVKNDSDNFYTNTINESHLISDYNIIHDSCLKIVYYPHNDITEIEFYDNKDDSISCDIKDILIFLRRLNDFLLKKNQNIAYDIFDNVLKILQDLK